MILTDLLIFLLASCVVSCAYWVVATICLAKVMRRPARAAAFTPSVSILKPVKGVDVGALENFASFCTQNYPDFEILFGVADPDDPAVSIVDELKRLYPKCSIRLFTTDPIGTNPKASILHALAAESRGEILVISDSDIRVTDDYLRRVVAPLHDHSVGLVTCLYRGESPGTVSAKLEALHMDATFAPSVALAWKLGTNAGLGATMVMRRADLIRAGGYAAIADHLLDDFAIAALITGLGLRVALSDYPVASVLGRMRFDQQWAREVRWSRGIRNADPLRYPGLPITFSFPLAILCATLSFVWPWAWLAVPFALAVRWLVGWRCAVLLGQSERSYLLWLPVRDVLSTAVWVAALWGRRVSWRGQDYLLNSDGRLTPSSGLPDGLLARAVRRLDAHLRRRQGIFEFSSDKRCVLRVNVATAEEDLRFHDGSTVPAGDPVGVLHLWNEQLPRIARGGPDLRWAMSTRQALLDSLAELARAAERDPRLQELKAFGGTAVFVSRNGDSQIARMARRYNFELFAPRHKPTLFNRLHRLGEDILVVGLQWAFNPAGMRGKKLRRPRERLWISRAALLERYGDPEPAGNRKRVAG